RQAPGNVGATGGRCTVHHPATEVVPYTVMNSLSIRFSHNRRIGRVTKDAISTLSRVLVPTVNAASVISTLGSPITKPMDAYPSPTARVVTAVTPSAAEKETRPPVAPVLRCNRATR